MNDLSGFVLGVDLGVSSLGLALIDQRSQQIVHTAVRVFPAGVEGDFASGRDESRAVKRRQARLARRQVERRKRRQARIFHLLQRFGLLPDGDPVSALAELDRELTTLYPPHPGVPYTLRAKALEEALRPYEVGRVLYHLAQRRGFLSNRKAEPKKDEEAGKVKEQIASLWADLSGRTLGQYFATLNPHETRIRGRYTERKMYEEEFGRIWASQGPHHPTMTEVAKIEVHTAIFHQRPLKDQSEKIGTCVYTGEKRAAAYELDAQQYRLLEKVNNLRVEVDEVSDRALRAEERERLVAALTVAEELTYRQAVRILGLPKATKFSIERGGEKKIHGNVTYARFAEKLNLRWEQMERPEQEALVRLWADSDTDAEFRTRLEATGAYTEGEITALLDVRLPEYRMGLSLAAMRRLIPRLRNGENQRRALEEEFPEAFQKQAPQEFLPPVLAALPELRNPAVTRPLTELRKALNELIRKYGRPEKIRIELARDLKRNRKERMDLIKENREQEARRQRAKQELEKHGITPNGRFIEKYLLWEQCNQMCPYSGRSIPLKALEGGEFEVEHIIPLSRSLDNSFANKTLSARDYNQRKGNQTPWEAFGATGEWDEMVERVRRMGHRGKLKRFQLTEADTATLLQQFSSNQLNDTRYMSRLATKYVGLLYGTTDGVDAGGVRRVGACAGGVTALLRRMWQFDRILNPDEWVKSRDDHRHHAVDAATVAMAGQGMIQRIATAAGRAEAEYRRLRSFEEPWAGFGEQLKVQILEKTVVSHRPERKLSGALHEETLYGRPHEEGGKPTVHIRKPVSEAAKDLDSIVDPCVRAAVEQKLQGVGGEYKRLEEEPPMLKTRKGALIPIRRVRVKVRKTTVRIGSGARVRNVVTGDNHHMAVFEIQKRGRAAYVGDVVSRLEAVERQRKGLPVVQRDRGADSQFLFTLSMGDMVRWKGQLWRVNGVTGTQLDLKAAADARAKKDIDSSDRPRPTINTFCAEGGRKVHVSRLGVIREAHD